MFLIWKSSVIEPHGQSSFDSSSMPRNGFIDSALMDVTPTPLAPPTVLQSRNSPVTDAPDVSIINSQDAYMSVVGALLHAAVTTRLDLAFASANSVNSHPKLISLIRQSPNRFFVISVALLILLSSYHPVLTSSRYTLMPIMLLCGGVPVFGSVENSSLLQHRSRISGSGSWLYWSGLDY